MDAKELRKLKKFAQLRIDQLEMFKQRGMGHIGGCLSVTELISVLYGKQMKVDPKNPNWEGRDYLVMSKGHAAPAVEAALAELGFFDKKLLLTMDDIGTRIPSHVGPPAHLGIDVPPARFSGTGCQRGGRYCVWTKACRYRRSVCLCMHR